MNSDHDDLHTHADVKILRFPVAENDPDVWCRVCGAETTGVAICDPCDDRSSADGELTNATRAQLAEMALAVIEDGQGRELAVVDLMANLMHLCDRDGFDFDELMAAAEDHYDIEVEPSP
jgi:hypothetical protein